MSMFCYQCQETAKGTGCEVRGVCGKTEEVAKLQDLLIYTLKGIAKLVEENHVSITNLTKLNHELLKSLFITITNANFDEDAIELQIKQMIDLREKIKIEYNIDDSSDVSSFVLGNRIKNLEKASMIGVLATKDEDVRSLREMITYGLKGMAAYTHHALNLEIENIEIYQFLYEALNKVLSVENKEELIQLTLRTGEFGVKAMALLDAGNIRKYGSPEITKVNIGVGKKPGILISGHDLTDLEQLLEQTKGTGIDIYTHSEMLPAHYYPFFKKYDNLVGNYGNAWWKQITEFETFNGPVLFTTNCIVPPKKEAIKDRIFTTGAAGYPGCKHIDSINGKKDFSEIISLAKTCKIPEEIEHGEIIGGFAHGQIVALADKVVAAVKSGAIRKFVVMAGCDGRMKDREYYTKFAEGLPKDTIILTAGCAKYRYNKLDLGDIEGIPRVLDAGQCNDSYSLALVALKLKDIFGVDDINKLPIFYNIAWYEQKAVIVLLALLALGVKNIHIGPTLPGFLSPNVAKILVENFYVSGINTVDDDLKFA